MGKVTSHINSSEMLSSIDLINQSRGVNADIASLTSQLADKASQSDLNKIVLIDVKKYKCSDGQYVKGDGIHDDTTGIQAAFNDAANNLNLTTGIHPTVFFPAGDYKVTGEMQISPLCHISPIGLVNIYDYGTSNTNTLKIISNASDPTTLALSYNYPMINGIYGALKIQNQSGITTKIGVYITNISTQHNNMDFGGLTVFGYSVGVMVASYNIYCNDYSRLDLEGNTVGIQFGDPNVTQSGFGERITMNNCHFALNDCSIRIYNGMKVIITNASLDYSFCHVYIDSPTGSIVLKDCWIEGTGYKVYPSSGGTYRGFGGIVRTPDSVNWYDKSYVYLINTQIVHATGTYSPTQLFIGTTMILTLDNVLYGYDENLWKTVSIAGTITNAFAVHDGVRQVITKNVRHMLTAAPLLQSKMSVINPYFPNDAAQSLTISGGSVVAGDVNKLSDWSITASQNLSNCSISQVDGMNVIGITSLGNGLISQLTLQSKNSYRIKGDNFSTVGFIKGWVDGNSSRWESYVVFYDAADAVITTTQIQNSYRTDTIDSTKWIFPYINYASTIVVPNNAVTFKAQFLLRCNNGGVSPNPVYITGLHLFNY
jgi:hypothetical protein